MNFRFQSLTPFATILEVLPSEYVLQLSQIAAENQNHCCPLGLLSDSCRPIAEGSKCIPGVPSLCAQSQDDSDTDKNPTPSCPSSPSLGSPETKVESLNAQKSKFRVLDFVWTSLLPACQRPLVQAGYLAAEQNNGQRVGFL